MGRDDDEASGGDDGASSRRDAACVADAFGHQFGDFADGNLPLDSALVEVIGCHDEEGRLDGRETVAGVHVAVAGPVALGVAGGEFGRGGTATGTPSATSYRGDAGGCREVGNEVVDIKRGEVGAGHAALPVLHNSADTIRRELADDALK